MMDDPAVFIDFLRNTLGFTTQGTIDVITKFVKSFGDFLDVNDGYIGTFVKDNYSEKNTRAAA